MTQPEWKKVALQKQKKLRKNVVSLQLNVFPPNMECMKVFKKNEMHESLKNV